MKAGCTGAFARAVLRMAFLPLDAAYAQYVGCSYKRWEARQQRDANGILDGAADFAMGEGAPAVLAVHGFADSPAVWRPLAGLFAEHGLHFRAMRLPGAAEPCVNSESITLQIWLDAVAAEVRRLAETGGRVWLLGHSMGGALALKYMLANSGSVEGAVVLAPLLRVSRRRSPIMSPEKWFKLVDPLLRRTACLQSPFGMQAKNPVPGLRLPRDKFFSRAVYRSLFKVIETLAENETGITAPLLMINCADDRTVDPMAAEKYFKASPSVRKRLITRSDCGHAMPVDQGWAEMGCTIIEFIKHDSSISEA